MCRKCSFKKKKKSLNRDLSPYMVIFYKCNFHSRIIRHVAERKCRRAGTRHTLPDKGEVRAEPENRKKKTKDFYFRKIKKKKNSLSTMKTQTVCRARGMGIDHNRILFDGLVPLYAGADLSKRYLFYVYLADFSETFPWKRWHGIPRRGLFSGTSFLSPK